MESNVVWFKVWLKGMWIWFQLLFLKSLDSTLLLQIQWYRWDVIEAFGVYLNTHKVFWGHMHMVWWLQRYIYEIQTDIEIHMIHMRYKPLGLVWVHTEVLDLVLWRFCPLGTRLCMHKYEEIWGGIFLSIRVVSGSDGT